LVAGGGGFRGVIYAESATLVVESLIAGVLAHRAMRSDLGFSWLQTKCSVLGDEIRHIVRFMIYTDLTSLANVFVKEGDVVILGLARGPTEAGYYRLAKALAAPIGSIVLPLQQAVYPRLAAMAGTGDVDGLRRATRRYTERIGIPIGALLLVALPLLPVVVPGMAGEDYRPAVATAAVLLAGAALTIPAFWARPMILAGGDVRVLFGISVVGTVLTVAGYVVFGNLWGGVGVAASRAVFASVLGTLALVVFSRPR
jgi:O-antigen/teichoic acid export membrane protein